MTRATIRRSPQLSQGLCVTCRNFKIGTVGAYLRSLLNAVAEPDTAKTSAAGRRSMRLQTPILPRESQCSE